MVVRFEPPKLRTIADLIRSLGNIPAKRIRLSPLPSTATVKDVETNKYCELIDGTLVEKAMGMRESILAAAIIDIVHYFVKPHKMGMVTAPDGTIE